MVNAQTVTIGGCTTPTGTSGCTDPCANNYNANALIDDGTCVFDAEPTIQCWETNTYNTNTCSWETTGEMPVEPVVNCDQTTSFNEVLCAWAVGTLPPITDDGCEFTDDSYDPVTCEVFNVSNCPDGTLLNTVDCLCETVVVEGCTDPCATNYNPDANSDDGSCTLPTEPPLECWETSSFNTTTCVWEVSGTMPEEPVTECWQTATFETERCEWSTTGQQPNEPSVACYEQAVFNNTTCVWDVIGEEAVSATTVTTTQICVEVSESPVIASTPVFTINPTVPTATLSTYEVCYNLADMEASVEYTVTITYGDCTLTETYTKPCIDCTNADIALDIQENLNYDADTQELCLVDGGGNPLQGYVTNDDKLTIYTLGTDGCVIVPLDNNNSVDFYPTPENASCQQCVYCIKP